MLIQGDPEAIQAVVDAAVAVDTEVAVDAAVAADAEVAVDADDAVAVVAVAAVVAEIQAFVTWLHVYGPHVLLKIPQVPLHWMSQLFPAEPWAQFAVTVPQHKAL